MGWQPSQEAEAAAEDRLVTCIANQDIESLPPYLSPGRSRGTHEPKVELPWNVRVSVSSPAQHSRWSGAVQEGACLAAENPGKWLMCARSWPWSCEATASVPRSWRGPSPSMSCRASFITGSETGTACDASSVVCRREPQLTFCIRIKQCFHFSVYVLRKFLIN